MNALYNNITMISKQLSKSFLLDRHLYLIQLIHDVRSPLQGKQHDTNYNMNSTHKVNLDMLIYCNYDIEN